MQVLKLRELAAVAVCLLSSVVVLPAQSYLDTVVFGDTSSETAHTFVGPDTALVTNSAVTPPQVARVGLPSLGGTNDYGGSLTVTMTVDPAWRNYFTLKLWGSDDTTEDIGRIYLYVPMSNYDATATNNYQIGYRHEGDYTTLNASASWRPLPGRFFYTTTLLPLWMTQGRTNLTLKVVTTGRYYALATPYQRPMTQNSRTIYQAYTHTQPGFDPVGEVQGSAPVASVSPSTLDASIMQPGGSFYNGVVNNLNSILNASVSSVTLWDSRVLAQSYAITNLFTCTNPAVVAKVVAVLDYCGTSYLANTNNGTGGWGGPYRDMGRAIQVLKVPLQSYLDTTNAYTVVVSTNSSYVTNMTRRVLWGAMLKTSRDYGRFNRRGISNQGMITDESLYLANAGLVALNDPDAIAETNAQRYIKEAVGILPWLGSDRADGSSAAGYGTNAYMVTAKGHSCEFGYVGSAYGEMQIHASDFYRYTGNPEFLAQAVKMAKARAPFRRPSMSVSGGSYLRNMEVIGIMAWRGVRESDSYFASYSGYAEPMAIAADSLDPDVVGYQKHMLEDNKYLGGLSYDDVYAFQDYARVVAAPDTGKRLPMADGQPDFAWSDEDCGIIAAKRGNERLWLSAYWEAGWGSGLNGIGRYLYTQTNYAAYGTLETSPQVNFGGNFYTRPNMLDLPYKTDEQPSDNPVNAYTGERLPLGAMDGGGSDDSFVRGRAQFWAARYRNFLIGINRDNTKSFELKTPAGFTSAQDLITGQMKSGKIMVAPHSTVVLYLDSVVNPNALPFAPLSLNAVGSSAPSVALDWSASGGALGYNLKRSVTKGGPYTTIANLTTTSYTDTNVSPGLKYYYVVSGTNTLGESEYNSMEFPVTVTTFFHQWKFDETNGTTAYDSWSDAGGLTCTLISGASWTNGVNGGGVALDGTSSGWVDVRDGIATSLNDFTICTWVKINVSAMWSHVFDFGKNTSYYMCLIPLTVNNTVRYSIKNGGGEQQVNGPTPLSIGVWHHVAVTQAGTTAILYVDGLPVGTNTITIKPSDLGNTAYDYIGKSQNTSGPYVNGSIDDFRIYNRALSPAEIAALNANVTLTAPTGLNATTGNSQVTLSWNAVSGAAGYNVKRSTVNGGPYVAFTNVTTTGCVDGGLTAGTYYYVVSAVSPVGEGPNSAQASATPTAPPTTPTGLTGTPGDTQVALSWNSVSGATSYILRRATTSGGPYTSIVTNVLLSYTDTGLVNGTAYYYVVAARNAAGTSGDSTPVSLTPIALPGTPANLAVSSSASQASLSWSAASNATLYKLKRSLTSGGPYTTMATVSGTNCVDFGLANGTPYYYVVSGLNGNGESANSAQVSTTPISVPVLAHRYSFSEANGATTAADSVGGAAWNGTLPNGGTFSSGKLALTSGSSQYLRLPPGILSNFTAVTIQTWVTFPVTLPNNCFFFGFGNVVGGAGTNYIFCQPKAGRAAITDTDWHNEQNANTGVDFSLRTNFHLAFVFNPPGGVLTIYTNGVRAAINTGITIPMSSVNAVSNWVARSLYSGDSYTTCTLDEFRIYNGALSGAQVALANSLGADQLLPTTLPAVPAGLTATPTNTQVTLRWNAASGATNYSVKCSLTDGSGYVTLTNLTGTNFVHTGLVNGTTYYYVVSALNIVGESSVSAQASARLVSLTSPQVQMGIGGGQLQLTWPPANTGWRLMMSTNLSSGNWTDVSSNVVMLTNQMSVPIVATNASVFYRLVYP